MSERDELQVAADELLRKSAYHRDLAEKFEVAAQALLGAPMLVSPQPVRAPEPAKRAEPRNAGFEPDDLKPGQTFRNKKRAKNMPHIEAIMRENAGRALHAREVVDLMAKRGHPVETADPVNNVGTGLRRLARQKGLVVELGDRRFQWVGEQSEAASNSDDESPSTNGHAENGAHEFAVSGPSAW